jgi:Ca2+-binding EF-hand superfamily protein
VHCGPTIEHEKEHERVLHGRPLSDKEHHDDLDHDYDHDAFLGEDQANEFDELTPEESQRRLAVIVDRIDENGDGLVSVEELARWIKFTQTRYTTDDVQRQWASHKVEGKETISWAEYRHNVYGFLDEEGQEQEDGFSYQQMETRDARRWTMADQDHSGELDIQEFSAFLHPEDAEHMRDIVVTETLEDIDKDGDGKVMLHDVF